MLQFWMGFQRGQVYFFYGKNGLPLYIGKSVTLRSRVMSHFSGDHASFSDMRIAQEVERVEWTETAGELSALLLEAPSRHR